MFMCRNYVFSRHTICDVRVAVVEYYDFAEVVESNTFHVERVRVNINTDSKYLSRIFCLRGDREI